MTLLDRVKFDGPPDVLVWKWPSEALSVGAQLIVNESQEALFYKSGQALDLFSPGTHTLTAANLPFLERIINLPFGGKTPFSAEIYFVSKAVALAQDWGTKTPFMVLDPKYKVSIPLRAYGQFGLRIVNSREFVVQIAGASGGGTGGTRLSGTAANDTARNMLESLVLTCLQQVVGTFLSEQSASVLDMPSQSLILGKKTHDCLRANYQTFGVELLNFALESINFDPKDESVQRLRSMLDEAARLSVVGDAFRRNQDFYRTDRQFDVLQGAAESEGGAGSVVGAALGIGMGFGVAAPAGALARETMAPIAKRCSKCGTPNQDSSKFCSACGEKLSQDLTPCPKCGGMNPSTSKFCASCGTSLVSVLCSKCGAALAPAAHFCNQCGEKI